MADKPKKKSNVFYLVCIAVMIISIAYVIWYFAGHSKGYRQRKITVRHFSMLSKIPVHTRM